MKTFSYSFPRKTVFGSGASLTLADELPAGAKILLILGKSASQTDVVRKIQESLKDRIAAVVTGVPAEPPLEAVDSIIETGRKNLVNTVCAIGGGSVMDAAKAAAALIPLEGKTADYFAEKRHICRKGLFFAALPTTAGTGSESTNNAVLTDPETKIKKSLRHPTMQADLAIVDPDLTLSCPPGLTAASGLDAFVQAFEAFTNPKATALTRALSAEAAGKILHSLERAYLHPADLEARTEMAEGSMISGLAFSQTGLGAVHGLAHPIGSLLKVPHGMACAILMKPVMEFNLPACRELYAELAQRCLGKHSAEAFIQAASELAEKVGVPENLRGYSFKREHFDFIIKNCRSASMKNNPREMTDRDVEELLEKLC